MPLQTPSSLTASHITESAINARSHYVAAAGHLNGITHTILSLTNDLLADFGNALGPQEMESLTASHAAQGEGVNALIAGVNEVLAASGIASINASVDIRPLSEKLAEQRREIVLTDGVFSVVDFPEPDPEPLIELDPEP